MSPAPRVSCHLPAAQGVLSACGRVRSAAEFGRALALRTAEALEAECCIWADRTAAGLSLLFSTPGAEKYATPVLRMAKRTVDSGPVLVQSVEGEPGLDSFAAVPMHFRSQVAGVLAVCNRGGGFSGEHLEVLDLLGRIGIVRFEQMRLAEEFSLPLPGDERARRVVADLTHELSQPLSVIAAAVFCADMIAPPGDERVRRYLQEVETQVESAAQMLRKVARSIHLSELGSILSDSETRDLTKPASSLSV